MIIFLTLVLCDTFAPSGRISDLSQVILCNTDADLDKLDAISRPPLLVSFLVKSYGILPGRHGELRVGREKG